MELSTGSILRGSDALISDARAKISEIKLLIRDNLAMVEALTEGDEVTEEITDNLNEALSLLMELDDR